jgi:hypothetical protein
MVRSPVGDEDEVVHLTGRECLAFAGCGIGAREAATWWHAADSVDEFCWCSQTEVFFLVVCLQWLLQP